MDYSFEQNKQNSYAALNSWHRKGTAMKSSLLEIKFEHFDHAALFNSVPGHKIFVQIKLNCFVACHGQMIGVILNELNVRL